MDLEQEDQTSGDQQSPPQQSEAMDVAEQSGETCLGKRKATDPPAEEDATPELPDVPPLYPAGSKIYFDASW